MRVIKRTERDRWRKEKVEEYGEEEEEEEYGVEEDEEEEEERRDMNREVELGVKEGYR